MFLYSKNSLLRHEEVIDEYDALPNQVNFGGILKYLAEKYCAMIGFDAQMK